MKLVIQTCKGYSKPIADLLRSIHFSIHCEEIIIVENKCDEESVGPKTWTGLLGAQRPITTIQTPRNLWEYVSFEKIAEYIEHPDIVDDTYFFLHDTCWVDSHEKFWKRLHYMSRLLLSDTRPDVIAYPGHHAAGHNIFMAKPAFITEFGSQFIGQDFSKKVGVQIEQNLPNAVNIHGSKHWPHRLMGKRTRERTNVPCYSEVLRHVTHYPSLTLNKAFVFVPGVENDHPNKP